MAIVNVVSASQDTVTTVRDDDVVTVLSDVIMPDLSPYALKGDIPDVEELKTEFAQTYATKSALDNTNGNVSNAQTAANLALANAQELVTNGGFETGDATGWSLNATYQIVDDMASAHSGRYYLNAGSAEEIAQPISVPVIPGHTYRFSGWYRRPSTSSSIEGGIRFQKSEDGKTYVDWLNIDFSRSEQDDWTYFYIDRTIPSDGSIKYAGYRLAFIWTTGVVQHFDDLSFKDITEAQAAQKAAEDAQATADNAQVAADNAKVLANMVASTYTTKSEFTQTTDKIQSSYAALLARVEELEQKLS
jgi:hypothetical protein